MKLSYCVCLKQQVQHTYHQHPDQANDPVLLLLTWANHGTSSTASRTSLINQTLQQQKTKPFICHSVKYVLSKLKLQKWTTWAIIFLLPKCEEINLFFFKRIKSSFSAQSSFSLQHFYKQLVYTEIKCYLWHISTVDIFFHKHFWSKKLNREREISYKWNSMFQTKWVTVQNGFNVSDETLKMGIESIGPIIPIYDT